MAAILVTSFGASWQIVPELYGFTNPRHLPLYRSSSDLKAIDRSRRHAHVPEIDEIWLVTTAGTEANVELVRQWAEKWRHDLRLRAWWLQGVHDLRSERDVRLMAELIFRVVALAHRQGAVLLSLAGGRKTMSADMQRAGQAFGYRCLLHVIDRLTGQQRDALRRRGKDVNLFQQPLPAEFADAFLPVVVETAMPASDAVTAGCGDDVAQCLADLPESGGAVELSESPLVRRIEEVMREADSLRANYAVQLGHKEPAGNFRALYTLPKTMLDRLRRERIAKEADRWKEEMAWLKSLPKAELHCHLGGLLSPAEMIEAAAAEEATVGKARRKDARFDADLKQLREKIQACDVDGIRRWVGEKSAVPDFRSLRSRWPGVAQPLGVCGFLLAFAGHPQLLDELIYGELRDPRKFHGIGIAHYERLGDLQGSGLLQSEAVLRATMRLLREKCRKENIRYLELRCSPANYVHGDMPSPEQVVEVLFQEAEDARDAVDIRLIFIASRHGHLEAAKRHVRLARGMLEKGGAMAFRIVGFDLAGNEAALEAAAFREMFRPLHERIMRITIHAGESAPVESVWQAVYELNADRIGHGLTLKDNPGLLARFRDRGIAVEMCPSSNFQIAGFADHRLGVAGRAYPLKEYLEQGLRVTINTDDPGISRTALSLEYHKAAAMSEDGLSRWQVLQLVRNGFRAAFCDHEARRKHLLKSEEAIIRSLMAASA